VQAILGRELPYSNNLLMRKARASEFLYLNKLYVIQTKSTYKSSDNNEINLPLFLIKDC
jgi:hypothetical protein